MFDLVAVVIQRLSTVGAWLADYVSRGIRFRAQGETVYMDPDIFSDCDQVRRERRH